MKIEEMGDILEFNKGLKVATAKSKGGVEAMSAGAVLGQ